MSTAASKKSGHRNQTAIIGTQCSLLQAGVWAQILEAVTVTRRYQCFAGDDRGCGPAFPSAAGRRDLPGGRRSRFRVQSSSKKYFASRFGRNSNRADGSRLDQRGVSRSSRTLERDAMDASCAFDERAARGRRSRVVLTPRRWRQVGDDGDVGPDGSDTPASRWRQWQESPVTGESAK